MQSDRPRQRRQVKSPGVLPLQVQDSPQISPTPPPIPDPDPPCRNRSSPPPSFPHNAPSSSSRSALSSCARPPRPSLARTQMHHLSLQAAKATHVQLCPKLCRALSFVPSHAPSHHPVLLPGVVYTCRVYCVVCLLLHENESTVLCMSCTSLLYAPPIC